MTIIYICIYISMAGTGNEILNIIRYKSITI